MYVFTGDGKGKTSAALWTGMRAVVKGERVAVVQFYKEARWPTAEQKLPALLKSIKSIKSSIGSFEVFMSGAGFYKLPTDHATPVEHRKAAQAGFRKAEQLVKSQKYFLVILDEVNNALKDNLIDLSALIDLISNRGKTHLVLTGRNAHRRIIGLADLVTEMKKVKHPFDKGIKAVEGLDY